MNTSNTVFITRKVTANHKIVNIYGVYSSEANAIRDLPREEERLEFSELYWIWENKTHSHYYRIDEYTVDDNLT